MYTTLIVEGKKYNISESQIRKVYREELQILALERFVPVLESLEQKYKNNLISESQYHELTEGIFDTIKNFIKAGLSKLGAGITRIKAPAALGRIKTDNEWINDKHLQQQTDKFVKQLANGADEGILQSKLVSFYKGRNISADDSRIIATYIVKNAKKVATDAAKAAGAPPQAVAQAAQAAQVTAPTTSRAFDTAQNRTDSPLSAPNAAMAALKGTGTTQQAATTDTAKTAQPAPEAGAAQTKTPAATATDASGEKNGTPAENAFRALVNAANAIIVKHSNIQPLYDDIISYLEGRNPEVGAQQATPLAKITDFDNLRINEKKYLKLKEATPEDQVVVGKGSESYALTGIIKKSILKNNLIDKANKKLAPGVDELIKTIYNSLSKYGLMKQQSKFNPSNITFDSVMSSGSSTGQRYVAAPASSFSDLGSSAASEKKPDTSVAPATAAAAAGVSQGRNQYNALATNLENITNQEKDPKKKEKLKAVVRAILKTLVGTKDNSFMKLANTKNVEITEAEQPVENQKVIFDLSTVISQELIKQGLSISDITEIGNAVSDWIDKNIGTGKDKTFIANINKKSPFEADEEDVKAAPPPAPADANDEPAATKTSASAATAAANTVGGDSIKDLRSDFDKVLQKYTSENHNENTIDNYKSAIRMILDRLEASLSAVTDPKLVNLSEEKKIIDISGYVVDICKSKGLVEGFAKQIIDTITAWAKKHKYNITSNLYANMQRNWQSVNESKQLKFTKRGNMFVLNG